MVSEAYVMINSEMGQEESVFEEVKKKEGVISAHRVFGVYDIIARVGADNKDALRDRISGKGGIREIRDVRSTMTLVSLEGFTKGKDGRPVDTKYNR